MILDGDAEVVCCPAVGCIRYITTGWSDQVQVGVRTAVRLWGTAKSQGLGQVSDCEGVGVAAGQSENMS